MFQEMFARSLDYKVGSPRDQKSQVQRPWITIPLSAFACCAAHKHKSLILNQEFPIDRFNFTCFGAMVYGFRKKLKR